MSKIYLSTVAIQKTFITLLGLIEGISSDSKIKPKEIEALRYWLLQNNHLSRKRPFNEVTYTIEHALADNVLTQEELEDIKYLCKKVLGFEPNEAEHTSKVQKLHGIASGIAVDSEIHPDEWKYLSQWILKNDELKGSWPYDEIEALVIKHKHAEKLTSEETHIILHYLNDFCGFNGNASLSHPLNEVNKPITGICAICPEIHFEDKTFCITGNSTKFDRSEIVRKLTELGGTYKDGMSSLVDYLIVCADGSPMWTYSCYGRKVEQAMKLRKEGHTIILVHEFDLYDAIEDVA